MSRDDLSGDDSSGEDERCAEKRCWEKSRESMRRAKMRCPWHITVKIDIAQPQAKAMHFYWHRTIQGGILGGFIVSIPARQIFVSFGQRSTLIAGFGRCFSFGGSRL